MTVTLQRRLRESDLFGLAGPGNLLWMTTSLFLQRHLVLTMTLNDRYLVGSATVS